MMEKSDRMELNGMKVFPFSSPKELLAYVDNHKGILVAVNAEKVTKATDETRAIVNNNIGSDQGDNTMGGGVTNLNQDDIESMTILKGAAATALYGSRAANGVILVTTKSGSNLKDKNFMVELNAGMQWSTVGILPQLQNVFGQGWDGSCRTSSDRVGTVNVHLTKTAHGVLRWMAKNVYMVPSTTTPSFSRSSRP